MLLCPIPYIQHFFFRCSKDTRPWYFPVPLSVHNIYEHWGCCVLFYPLCQMINEFAYCMQYKLDASLPILRPVSRGLEPDFSDFKNTSLPYYLFLIKSKNNVLSIWIFPFQLQSIVSVLCNEYRFILHCIATRCSSFITSWIYCIKAWTLYCRLLSFSSQMCLKYGQSIVVVVITLFKSAFIPIYHNSIFHGTVFPCANTVW